MALYDSDEEAAQYIEELISNLHETDSDALPGFESTIYSKLDENIKMVQVVEVLVWQPGTPTDDDTIALVTEETTGVTEVLGDVQDETTKRIVTVDLTEESETSPDDDGDPVDRPDVDPDQLPD